MNKTTLLTGALASAMLLYVPAGLAESLIDGIYISDGAANGTGQCTLTIRSISETHKYGDETFELESSGDGACEWSAIGLSKSYAITGGLVTSGGAPAFVKLTFPFGPAGKKMELTAFDLDGSLRNSEVFAKQ
ncbi:MAG: hypothetical protein COA96_03455 [SAR86 cluster bacterium]|uniref:Uncharacterized protein n=1 Tax=SAR86 cluster bacterium TaxID=2030880 RepID=A0A2A5B6X7_9GAMM|nr:MAG: hypothetical protein COA96_03455 [SAR86 cluster bacterium]